MADYSPMIQQYLEIKAQYQEEILLYRLGDFYEMFFDDAITASKELELTLTGRDCGQVDENGNKKRAPMCGVPYHSVDTYIDKLISKGFKVAICEQVEDPASAKGIVKRQVRRVVTAGTVTSEQALDEKSNNYLCCIYWQKDLAALAFVDITTGDLYVCQNAGGETFIMGELSRYNPSEIIVNPEFATNTALLNAIGERFNCTVSRANQIFYADGVCEKKIQNQFGKPAEALPISGKRCAIYAIGVLLGYLEKTQMCALPHISEIIYYDEDRYVGVDYMSKRNLELTRSMRDGKKYGTLLWVLEDAKTAMGGRMLTSWLEKPLTSCALINRRLDAVEELVNNRMFCDSLREALSKVLDLERLVSKTVTGGSGARELRSICNSLQPLPALALQLQDAKSDLLKDLLLNLDTMEDLQKLLDRAIVDSPPLTVREGGLIRAGYNEKVDFYNKAITDGAGWIAELEQKEAERTGIKNIKIRYNRVFGYYIEVSNANKQEVPDRYIRKQTLANCERYITEELKEIEDAILNARENICQLEYQLFCELRTKVAQQSVQILKTAKAIASVDCLCSLAVAAQRNGYCKPVVNLSDKIEIHDGRHPVVEKVMKGGLFVPNDVFLSKSDRFGIITGPNMAGKSTYMRQVALIVLMAQVGSYVPAARAEIGIVDQIFTRVGASDDLASGQSTFMVEMTEVANILDHATSKSLLILDEIGRGTSTYDGLSIAWAVVEYISNPKKLGAKTLFATHYHELTELEGRIEGVKNFCIAVKKRGDDIIFLRKIIRGGADDSYGVEVAKLAGVKKEVIKRAQELVYTLESANINKTDLVGLEKIQKDKQDDGQVGFAGLGAQELVEQLQLLDVTTLTPIEALNKLYEFKTKADLL